MKIFSFTVQSEEHVKHFESLSTISSVFQPSETESLAKMSGTSPDSAADNQNWVYDFLLSDWLTQNQNIVSTAKELSSSEMASVKAERGEVLCRMSKESQ